MGKTREGSEFFSREVEFMRWFPVAFLTNSVFKSDTINNLKLEWIIIFKFCYLPMHVYHDKSDPLIWI